MSYWKKKKTNSFKQKNKGKKSPEIKGPSYERSLCEIFFSLYSAQLPSSKKAWTRIFKFYLKKPAYSETGCSHSSQVLTGLTSPFSVIICTKYQQGLGKRSSTYQVVTPHTLHLEDHKSQE